MKILNLYAWIGGNRKLRGNDHEITAVEYVQEIADIYKDLYPNDTVIVWDAHQYLLDHYKDFDFIWSSPPCPSHSDIRRCWVHAGQYEALYPDMKLYEEIILLKHFAQKEQKRVVENVKPYYDLLIPAQLLERHLFRSNFTIPPFRISDDRVHNNITGNWEVYWFNLDKYKAKDKRKLLRNMVNPELWKHIFDASIINKEPICLF
jgi:DNA (cytosine-5)-methyltransferase 1